MQVLSINKKKTSLHVEYQDVHIVASVLDRVQTSALFILPANICSSLASCNMLIYSAERSMHACKDAVSFFLVLFLSHAAERKQRR
jgi:hypothetical protein